MQSSFCRVSPSSERFNVVLPVGGARAAAAGRDANPVRGVLVSCALPPGQHGGRGIYGWSVAGGDADVTGTRSATRDALRSVAEQGELT